jgi:hypothetical protein
VGKVLVFDFSSFLARPEAHLRRACEHLKLSFEPSMLEGWKHTPRYRGASSFELTSTRECSPESIDRVAMSHRARIQAANAWSSLLLRIERPA